MIPVSGPITQGFGCTTFDNPAYPIVNGCRWHSGIDYEPGSEPPSRLLAPAGSPSLAGVTPNYGNVGDIDHANGLRSRYAHLFEVRVGPGQSVAEGDVIELVGRTGNSTGLAGQRGWSLIRRTLESADLDLPGGGCVAGCGWLRVTVLARRGKAAARPGNATRLYRNSTDLHATLTGRQSARPRRRLASLLRWLNGPLCR